MKVQVTTLLCYMGIFIFSLSCNNAQEPRQDKDTTAVTPPVTEQTPQFTDPLSGCYMRVSGRDTLFMQLAYSSENVTGKIWFDNYQYDGSSGNLHGKLHNDTLRLLYNFEAEGTKNIMELIFKIEDQSVIRGEGEMAVKGDTVSFVSPDEVSFPETGRMDKVECDVWDGNR